MKLGEYLEAYKVSQEEFSTKIERSRQHLNRMINNKCVWPMDLVLKVEELTGGLVTRYDLMGVSALVLWPPAKEGTAKKKKSVKKEVLPIKTFELTSELVAWGYSLPEKWTPDEMRLHFEYFCNYLRNKPGKPYRDLASAFKNAVSGNWARLRSNRSKTYSDRISEANDLAAANFLGIVEGGGNGIKKLS